MGCSLTLSALQTCRLQKRTLSLESVPRLSSRAELQSCVCHSETVRTQCLTPLLESQSLQTSQVSVHILWILHVTLQGKAKCNRHGEQGLSPKDLKPRAGAPRACLQQSWNWNVPLVPKHPPCGHAPKFFLLQDRAFHLPQAFGASIQSSWGLLKKLGALYSLITVMIHVLSYFR